MSVIELVLELHQRGISLSLAGQEIEVSCAGDIPEDVIVRIKEKKAELTQFLATAQASYQFKQIPSASTKDYYQASSTQKRLFILQQLNLPGTAYNMSLPILLPEQIERETVVAIFAKLVNRHESLRTSFEMLNGELVQKIHEHLTFDVLEFTANTSTLEDLHQRLIKPFDLGQAPLWRLAYIKLEDGRKLVLLDIHHIIADGVSLDILEKEFHDLYNGNELPELNLQYKDYSEWVQTENYQKEIEPQGAYWLNQLSGELPVLELPYDYPRPNIYSFEGASIGVRLDENECQTLRDICSKYDVTLYMCLLAVTNVWLSKLSGQEDIIVGSPVAARSHTDIEKIVGMFANTLPMRSRPSSQKCFSSFLQEVKRQTLLAYENQEYTFETLVEKLNDNADRSRNPLFDVLFVLQSQSVTNDSFSKDDFFGKRHVKGTSKFDITIDVLEEPGSISIKFNYCTALFEAETIDRFINYFRKIICALSATTEDRIGDIKIITDQDEHQLLNEFNDTSIKYPDTATIIDLFEEQVKLTPSNTALLFDGISVSYDQLNKRSNQLAHSLIKRGVEPDNIIGIVLDRSIEMVIAILGILKSGCAYLPIDPTYPEERIKYIISNSGIRLLLTNGPIFSFSDEQVSPEILDIRQRYIDDEPENIVNPVARVNARNLAYVIYTSGSTGMPKGVMIEHSSLVNRLCWMKQLLGINVNDRILQKTSYAFDVSVWELLLWGIAGAGLVLLQPGEEKDPDTIISVIEKQKITIIHFVPAMLKTFLRHVQETGKAKRLSGLKQVICSGEALGLYEAELFAELLTKENGTVLYNLYGPTEATIDVSYFLYNSKLRGSSVPIGKPIDNTQLMVLNKDKGLQGIGIAGEIYIGGVGIARGYLNNEQLTAEKFVSNPFRPGERMYRTGDIGRWLPDGNIEYLGRKDEQVKLRGYRIELGEIESQLQKHPQIKNAVVIARGEGADKALCAYYVATQEDLSSASLRSYLSSRLPDYMIPTSFMQLESIPLTPNGKVNRQALPVPAQEIVAYCGPRNETEVALVDIWSAVLAIAAASISIDSNFFSIGGHSLRAMTVVSKIHRLLGVKLPVSALFDQPTISRLSGVIATATPQRYGGIKKAAVQPWYRLSSGQKRLYILQQLDPQSVGYNMGVMIPLGKGFNYSKVASVFEQLIQRHESLRTCFELLEGEPVQRIWTEAPLQVTLIEQQDSTLEQIQASFIRPFDLSQAPLLRVCYVHGAGGDDVLLVDMHHIISDGRSEQVLEREFWQLYNGEVLSESPIQYKDYSEWLQTPERQAEISKQSLYWQQVLSGELPVLGLPYDYPRPSIYSFEGASVQLRLTEKECQTLQSICRQEGVTLYMCLLSVVTIWLSKLSGQEDILIGSPVSGRGHEEVDDVVGMFVNTLVMRNDAGTEKMFSDFLQEVKQGAVSAYANQGYGFEELVEKLSVSRDRSRNPLFDVLFVLQSVGEHTIWYNRDKPVQDRHINGQSKFDMTIQAEEREGSIVLRIEYCRALFTAATIDRFIGYLRNLITALGVNPLRTIGALPMLDDKEVHQLLQTFNDTAIAYDRDRTIVELFEEQVKRYPDKVGLLFGEHSFAYRQLNERANQLADYLRKRYRVEPDELIGIQLDRSEWLVISMLGILKSGAAYVPIDPLYPRDRIDYMIADSRCKVVIDEQELNHFRQQDQHYRKDDLGIVIQPSNLAYVMYTSGSTGLPKGVMIEHKSVHAFIHWCAAEFSRAGYSVVFATTSICFDLSVFELFYPLSIGTKIRLLADAQRLGDYLATEENILLNTVPTVVGSLLAGEANLENVRVLNMAGEPIPVGYIDKLDVSAREIRNLYGPSEDTTYSTCYRITHEGKVLIGRPIWNTQVYILGAAAQLVPVGVAGEICIGGEGIARGYLNNEQLTAEKFVSNPFRPSERMYRTGDIGRWLPDGNIEYLGRKDEQVKLRGYRIELGEIESQLQKHPQIKNAVVIARGEGADKVLCAYYVATQEDLSRASLRSYLSTRLPDYMIPTSFMQLESIPLTPNGKVNRQALPVPAQEIAAYCGPRNETEVTLINIWSEVLAIAAASISIDSNFFSIGGHSLRAMTVVSKIHKLLGVKLPVSALFDQPTISRLSGVIATTTPQRYGGIKKAAVQPWYRLSSGQKRLYILQQLDPQSVGYNMGVMIPLGKGFDHSKVALVFEQLIQRHESLRTSFELLEGEPVQRIWTEAPLQITLIEQQDSTLEQIQASFIRPFDLSQAPLLRVCYVHGAGGDDVLLVDMHHIISDGRSEQVLEREFWQLYNGEVLSESPIQYKDYSEWVQTPERQAEISKQSLYWQQVLSGELPVLGLPYDYPRPSIYSFEGASVQLRLTEKECHTLQSLCRQEGVTLYMCLLSVVTIWLSKLSGQEDILIGSPVSGRSHEEVEDVVGMFVNTLVMRNDAGTEKMFSDFLQEVKQGAVRAYANQGYGFEELVEKLSVSRDRSRNPLFDVLFVLQSAGEHTVWYNRDESVQDRHINGQSKFDMTIQAEEREGGIVLRIEYCRALFTAATIDRFIGYLRNLITALGINPLRTIGALPMLDDKEVHQLLQTFNDTAVAYDRDRTIVELFEEQVKRCPDKVGLLFGEHSFTYRQLNERANQLADYLRKHYRVEPDELIGIQLERSEWLVISMLGILKSGAAYVPIDPLYPKDRIDYMIADSRCKVVIDEQELNHFKQQEQHYRKDDLGIVIQPSSLAYVMYTSGSTGLPKGVMIEHRPVVNFMAGIKARISFHEEDTILSLTGISFDIFLLESLYPLVNGIKMVLGRDEDLFDIELITNIIETNKVSILQLTPSRLQMQLSDPRSLRSLTCLMIGGEALPSHLLAELKVHYSGLIYNMYGPTETTVWSTIRDLKDIEKVDIGTPIANTRIYILDKNLQPQPAGVCGELYIGGDGLARGYLNNKELTALKFLADPFREGERIYKTGDVAKWLPDGNIEYIGRVDHQLKLRGHRIELGEIESILLKHTHIKNAVVIAKGEAAEKTLCAYYVRGKEPVSNDMLRSYLIARLPAYMVPVYFVEIAEMPLTPNGKINRKALPEPSLLKKEKYKAPQSELEKTLVQIWSEVLDIKKEAVGIQDNFFEIGGNSLKILMVQQKVNALHGSKVPIDFLFRYPTIETLTTCLGDSDNPDMLQAGIVQDSVEIINDSMRLLLKDDHE